MAAIRPTRPPTAPEPFWRRLGAIALYPLRGAALHSVIALTLFSLLGLIPGIGWVLSLLLWLGIYKYAFDILRATADGHMEAPEVLTDLNDGVVLRLIALQLLLIVAAFAAVITAGPVFGLLIFSVLVFLQPGCIISLAIDGSLAHALNPAVPLGTVGRIGWPYLAVFGLLLVIQASAITAGSWLDTWMPPVLGDLALTLVWCWGTFAAFHLMGYLVYQYHEQLGYEPGRHRIDADMPADRDRELRESAEALVAEGDIDAGRALLRGEVRSRAVDLETHELYQRLLRQGDDSAARIEHARLYLNLLLNGKHERRALQLSREALETDPDFVPALPEQGEQVAERAQLAGQSQLAVDMWRALLRAHPHHPNAGQWALATGLLLAERFGRDDEALALLAQARATCEDPQLQERLDAAIKPLRLAPG